MSRPHSKFGASSAYRWMACPASVGLIQEQAAAGNIRDGSSPAAEQGTRAHALLEYCLTHGVDAWQCPDLADDADMIVHVQSALDAFGSLGDGLVFIEKRVWPLVARVDVYGTTDFGHLSPEGILSTVDFKYGKGHVSATDNPQLLFYALGLLRSLLENTTHPVSRVLIGIHQPRLASGRIRWGNNISAIELREWGHTLQAAVDAAEAPGAPFVIGSHCRFCPARRMCPAQAALVRASFDTQEEKA